jgi:hypothetical protein
MTGHGRRRRQAGALVGAGVVLLVTSLAGAGASAQEAGEELGFFDVGADASGIAVSFGDPTSQPYPVAAGLVPNANTTLSAGPSGQARSSVLWPGPLVSNAGSLANVIGTPLPPEVVSNANYPVVAHAAASGGGSQEKVLGPMTAKVDGADSRASTVLSDVSAPDVVTATRVVTTSRSYVEGGKAIAIAETLLEGVQVAGAVDIARIRTVAKGITDGVTATTTQEVTIAGVKVSDQAATLDGKGLHVGGGTVPITDVLGGAKPAFDGFGMRAFVTDPLKQEATGGAAVLDSGSVIFEWSPPESGQFFTVVLGGSSVRVSATPGSGVAADTPADAFFAPADPGTVLPTPSFSPSADPVSSSFDDGALAAPSSGLPAGDGTAAAAAPTQSGASLELASAVSDRVPFGWVLVGMLGALLAGSGLHSFRQQALAAAIAGGTCPLERS